VFELPHFQTHGESLSLLVHYAGSDTNTMLQCDRKRPACARCTQLGLVRMFRSGAKSIYRSFTKTGLCVYEVDDPSQRTDTQDESSRLLKRVAELEGVIREVCLIFDTLKLVK
jgi:hypothetical protein